MGPTLQVAQTLIGAKGSYQLTQALVKGVHRSIVFKGRVLSSCGNLAPGSWVLIKTATRDRRKFLRREYDCCRRPAISSSPFIRKMYDIVGNHEDLDGDTRNDPPCLVFEWMDHTLGDLSPKDHLNNHVLHKAIFEAGLGSLAALHDENLAHTDLKPDNILISNIDSPKPIAKIGDLGLTAPDGFDKWQTQPFAMRAPEIWRGFGCSHRSDIWSLAVTVLVWLKPGILGTPGIKDGLWLSLWCMTKLMGVFPDWTGLPARTALIQQELETARLLLGARDPDQPEEAYINVSPLDDELRAMGILEELSNLLSCLLVADPEKRPDAAEALTSLEFQALLRKAASVLA